MNEQVKIGLLRLTFDPPLWTNSSKEKSGSRNFEQLLDLSDSSVTIETDKVTHIFYHALSNKHKLYNL